MLGHNAHVGKILDMGDLGITSIGKNAHIPPGYTVGRGALLGTDLRAEDFAKFPDKTVPNGAQLGFSKKKS